MFDETKDIWIKVYKVITVFLFFLAIISGTVIGFQLGFLMEKAVFVLVGIIVGGIFAFIILVSNMLILNFLKNVQIIRQKVEAISGEQPVVNEDDDSEIYEEYEQTNWACSCGRKNKESDSFCPNCGKPRPAAVGSNDNWRCSCGKINENSYMFCVACGKSKPKD